MTTLAELRRLVIKTDMTTEDTARPDLQVVVLACSDDGEITRAERAVLEAAMPAVQPLFHDTLEPRSYARENRRLVAERRGRALVLEHPGSDGERRRQRSGQRPRRSAAALTRLSEIEL